MTRAATLRIERLGWRGEGVGEDANRRIYIPFAAPGDTIHADIDGERGRLLDIVAAGPDRVEPFCPWFTICGGCATQHIALSAQLEWKRGLVIEALAREGITTDVSACIDAHGEGRRRATFHARREPDGRIVIGFMAARSHDIVAIDRCPLFAPEMAGALSAATSIAQTLAQLGKPLDIAVTATQAGLDLDVRGTGPLDDRLQAKLIRIAERDDVARLSNHGRTLVTFRAPWVLAGNVRVDLPPGGFLQATRAGEDALGALVLEASSNARRVADLFSGIGTFALRLAAHADVLAVETDRAAMAALLDAARAAPGLRAVKGDIRDLVRRPLQRDELSGFDAIVFDPPRAGAEEQARELSGSTVPLVVGVSCNTQTFARDAKRLIDGGYALERVTSVDQFRHSAHVELVGVFRRMKVRKKRRLLG